MAFAVSSTIFILSSADSIADSSPLSCKLDLNDKIGETGVEALVGRSVVGTIVVEDIRLSVGEIVCLLALEGVDVGTNPESVGTKVDGLNVGIDVG